MKRVKIVGFIFSPLILAEAAGFALYGSGRIGGGFLALLVAAGLVSSIANTVIAVYRLSK